MREGEYETMWAEELKLTNSGRSILSDIAKWTKFLSVLGFIFLGLSVIVILSAGILISVTNSYVQPSAAYPYHPGMFQWFYAVIYLIIIAIYFVPLYFLYKFSVNTKNALKKDDTDVLTTAFSFLKKHYMFIGILTIIMLVIYLIAFFMFFLGIMAQAL